LIAQVLGCLIGAAFALAILPAELGDPSCYGCFDLANNAIAFDGIASPNPTSPGTRTTATFSVSAGSGVGIELVLSFFIGFGHFGAIGRIKGMPIKPFLAFLPIGFAYFAAIAIGGSLTGGAFNPARAFGAAVVSGHWTNNWIYWLGPIIGFSFSALLHRFVFGRPKLTHAEAKRRQERKRNAAASKTVAV